MGVLLPGGDHHAFLGGGARLYHVQRFLHGRGNFPALEGVAWFCANSRTAAYPWGQTYPVGQKAANPWGLRDVHGNVFEMCWDWGDNYPTGSVTDYRGAASGFGRIIRGGDMAHEVPYCGSAFRVSMEPGDRNWAKGFRLVRTIP